MNACFFFHIGRVPEDEKIYRNVDDDDPKFTCPENFVPLFLEEALKSLEESNLTQAAHDTCGNDITCLFDIAATGQISFGQSTLSEKTEIENDISLLGKNWIT